MKNIIKKVKSFIMDRRGVNIPEYMLLAITVLISAGIIAIGYSTHVNTNATATTKQMDSSYSNAQSAITSLPQP